MPSWAAAARSATIAASVLSHRFNSRPNAGFTQRLASGVLVLLTAAVADAAPPYRGRPLDDVLRDLGGQGLNLIYSSETVVASMRVTEEPTASTPAGVLAEVLAANGLRAERIGSDSYAILRVAPAAPAEAPTVARAMADAPLEEIVVAASRYSLASELPDAHTLLTQQEIEGLPRLADDSLKAVHRLPGAASNGLSGLANIRGGVADETQVMLDGLTLYEPFHLRLLLNPVSVLDPAILSGLDVHAGGFTAEYGDRMSAVIGARSLRPEGDGYYELGASLFHLGALASHRFAEGRGQWFASVRRSNLDEAADLVDSKIGESNYVDAFARLNWEFAPGTRASLYTLLADDRLDVQNAEESESAQAEYLNEYLWGVLEHEFSPALSALTVASYTRVHSERSGQVFEPGDRVGAADDDRRYDVLGLSLAGSWRTGRWLHRFGAELRDQSAEYDYANAIVFEPGYPFPQSTGETSSFEADPHPSGTHLSAYATSRVLLTPALAAEFGLRWAQQSYSPDSDDQWSPRINFAWEPSDTTRLRASWGRYQQFQGINELQVEDGIDEFQRAQSSDHAIIGLEQTLPHAFSLRLEAYRKDYRDLMARYESLYDPLSLVPELRWDRVRIAPDSARAEGFEWLLTRRSDGPWNGWLGYTWSRVTDHVDGKDTRRAWDQTNSLGLGITWSSGPWQATAAFAWHTGWATTPAYVVDAPSPDARIALGPRNDARYGNYGSLDLRVSRRFALRQGTLSVFAEATNATNRANHCCTDLDYAYEGDTLLLEREYRDWLPLIPNLGVIWRY
jgi:outer membrane receptor protein involved in Fe transport